jgi:hypothetical protein
MKTFVVLAFMSSVFAEINMDLRSYPGKTKNERLTSAFTCMSKVKELALPGIKAHGLELAGNCLRYGFHDCGTFDKSLPNSKGGCNGGIRTTIANAIANGVYDTAKNPNAEDNGMRGCQELLVGLNGKTGICNKVRVSNPTVCGKMPFADCINFSAYLAVVATGGAPVNGCPWLPGRIDDVSIQKTSLLPSERSNANDLLKTFGAYNIKFTEFDIPTLSETVVLLSGGHTIGKARVHPEDLCNKGNDNLGATPKIFDTDYYVNIVGFINKTNDNNGWFCSDMHGLCNTIYYENSTITHTKLKSGPIATIPDLNAAFCKKADSPFSSLYIKYAKATQTTFHNNFCKAYQAMSFIGYNIPENHSNDAAMFAKLLK